MQNDGKPLSSCIDQLVKHWNLEYKTEAESGSFDAMLTYAQLLKRGSSGVPPDISQSFYWLKKASKASPEAAFRLGMAYKKGKYFTIEIEKSYFYFRMAMIFKCKCGRQSNDYHNHLISNVNSCYPYEAQKEIVKLNLAPDLKEIYEDHFSTWLKFNLK
jgi:TPR repeat protein